ncbi:MAG: zinc metallopeptidase [Gammaproteobacteria bacterium]|nr:zinc metallopeptidase [Gammaproteobacteria bacterium]
MPYIVLIVLLLLVVFLPQSWVRHVLSKYNQQDENNFPGTGGELARHLLDRFDLNDVQVETTELGDHYDPDTRCIRLTRDKFEGKSLTAITVATHEFGHALQHAANEPLFNLRSRLARLTLWASQLGSLLLFAAPLIMLITRAPSVAVFNIIGAFLIMGFSLVVQIVTLPVEIDASFNKALPILKSGYLEPHQLPGARKILKAAAWTYVAASLAGLLNFWRWLTVLRR